MLREGDKDIYEAEDIEEDLEQTVSHLELITSTRRCGEVLVKVIFPRLADLGMEHKLVIGIDFQNELSKGIYPKRLPPDFINFLMKHNKYNDFHKYLVELGYLEGMLDPDFIYEFWEILEVATLYIKGLAIYPQNPSDSNIAVALDTKEIAWERNRVYFGDPNQSVAKPHKKRGRPRKPDSEKKKGHPTGRPLGRPRKPDSERKERHPTGRPRGRPRKVRVEVDEDYQGDSITFHKGLPTTPVLSPSNSLTIHKGNGLAFSSIENNPTPPYILFENIISYYQSQARSHFNPQILSAEEANRISSFDIDISMLPEEVEILGADKLLFDGITYSRSSLGDILVTLISPYVRFPNFWTES